MPYKDPEKQKLAQREHYRKNKDKYIFSTKKRRIRNKKYSWDIKEQHGCMNCGMKNPICLDFHHRNHNDKYKTVAQLIVDATCLEKLPS